MLKLRSPKLAKILTIRPEESRCHFLISKSEFSGTRITVPPCLPKAGDQKLEPFHLERKVEIKESLTKVSCKQTKSACEFLAKSKIARCLASSPKPRIFKVESFALNV